MAVDDLLNSNTHGKKRHHLIHHILMYIVEVTKHYYVE